VERDRELKRSKTKKVKEREKNLVEFTISVNLDCDVRTYIEDTTYIPYSKTHARYRIGGFIKDEYCS
jgi:hypothetical protein